jgi:FtsP/CotA-like multicopper oxidase with cupredoxin domain
MVDAPDASPSGMSLQYNPISSLVKCNEGDKVLLRIANLGYEHHAMTLDGIPMTVVAKDASALVDQYHNLTYETNTVEVGPGESRDVIFTAPTNKGNGPDTYRLYDRNYAYLSNAGGQGYGGQMTEVRVYPGTLGIQLEPNA